MSEVVDLERSGGQAGQGQKPEVASSQEGCCLPIFAQCGPETCGLPITGERSTDQGGQRRTQREKVIRLTRAGALRLFNGEDDEIYSRDDLIQIQPDGLVKIVGACSGTVWLVQKDEIAEIVNA